MGLKKKLFGTILFLMLVSTVSALIMPLPIDGRLIGTNVGSQEIQITNQRSGDVVITRTNDAGEYLVEWANTPNKYFYGDTFEIRILACASYSNDCIISVTYTGQTELFTITDLSSLTLACPSTTCATVICSSGGGGGSYAIPVTQEACDEKFPPEDPIVKQCTQEECATVVCPPEKVCVDGEKECDVCPEQEQGVLADIWKIIIGLLVGGGAIYLKLDRWGRNKLRIKKATDGTTEVWHKHPLISGYHSRYTTHYVSPHKKGEYVPKYDKNGDSEWIYVGGD